VTLPNLVIILASAVIHVVAHVGLKRAQSRTAFAWLLLVWGALFFAPLLAVERPAWPAWIWAVLAASALCEAVYFLAIARAYETGDLAVVYPLARGTAPLWLLAWSRLLLGESLAWGGVGGVLVIALGLYLVSLPRLGVWAAPLQALRQPAPRWALLAGLAISAYTGLDNFAMRSGQASPLLYTYLTLAATALVMAPIVLRRPGVAGLRAEVRASGRWSALAGLTTLAAYALVLLAMQRGTPAGYAGAVREISVVLGAAVGIIWLGEPGGRMRLFGAGCVAVGVALVALLG
jgi:multidrug transporter EmrE-like cation transporter